MKLLPSARGRGVGAHMAVVGGAGRRRVAIIGGDGQRGGIGDGAGGSDAVGEGGVAASGDGRGRARHGDGELRGRRANATTHGGGIKDGGADEGLLADDAGDGAGKAGILPEGPGGVVEVGGEALVRVPGEARHIGVDDQPK